MTDKNDEKLIVGAVYKTPRSEIELKLIQRGESLFLKKYSGEEFPVENFIADDEGVLFYDIYLES